jgi:hypothetical protein
VAKGTAVQLRRVAVTGIGVVSALGNSLADFRSALASGRAAVRRLPEEVTRGSGVQVGALIDWDPAAHFKGNEAGSLDRVAQFALAAAGQAIAASGLDPEKTDRNRVGVYWGTGMGGANTLETAYSTVYGKNDFRLRPLTVVMAMNNAAPSSGVCAGRSRIFPPPALRRRWRSARRRWRSAAGAPMRCWPEVPKPCSRRACSRVGSHCARSHRRTPPTLPPAASPLTSGAADWCSAKARPR